MPAETPVSSRRACPSCGSKDLYTTHTMANGAGHGPSLLPRLGALFMPARFDLFLCRKCGHVSFFATADTLERLPSGGNSRWRPVV